MHFSDPGRHMPYPGKSPDVSFVHRSARMDRDIRNIAAVDWQAARCLQQSASIDDVHVVEIRRVGDLRRGVPENPNRRNAITW